jgi:membrane-bound ClpP family serine protease
MFLKSKFPTTLKLFPAPGIGEVDQAIAAPLGKGTIKFQGSLWRAQVWYSAEKPTESRQLMPNEMVWVIGRIGLTLLVQPYAVAPREGLELEPNALAKLKPFSASRF